jgi:hypothetical protein
MTTASLEQKRVIRALDRLGRERFVAFLRAVRDEGGCMAVELANAALDAGDEVEAVVAWDEAMRSGYYLSVRKRAERRFEIGFGYVAGGLAGDGGTWTVTFNGDGSVGKVEPGLSVMF